MKHPTVTWQQVLPAILIIGSIVGLSASFVLTYDKLHIMQDPSYQPGCNLNPVLSCGSVMNTTQAMLFGVPNTLFGLAAFSALAMFGGIVASGARLRRWIWLAAQAMAAVGVVFVHYLIYVSAFQIHAICPWCFGVWMVTIAIFFGITMRNIREGALQTRRPVLRRLLHFIDGYATDLIILWYGAIFALLLWRFWHYWQTLL